MFTLYARAELVARDDDNLEQFTLVTEVAEQLAELLSLFVYKSLTIVESQQEAPILALSEVLGLYQA